jgi:hypothetical protein
LNRLTRRVLRSLLQAKLQYVGKQIVLDPPRFPSRLAPETIKETLNGRQAGRISAAYPENPNPATL